MTHAVVGIAWPRYAGVFGSFGRTEFVYVVCRQEEGYQRRLVRLLVDVWCGPEVTSVLCFNLLAFSKYFEPLYCVANH